MTVGRMPLAAVGYAVVLLATSIWLEMSSPGYEHRVLQGMSTDVWHLSHDPWVVLPGSAFFTTGGLPYALAGALVCMGLLEREAGLLVTLLVAVSAHLIATGLSEGVLAIRVAVHDLPSSARHELDVGPSYVLVACATRVRYRAGPGVRLHRLAHSERRCRCRRSSDRRLRRCGLGLGIDATWGEAAAFRSGG